MKKKVLAALLAAAMVIGAVPAIGFAEEETEGATGLTDEYVETSSALYEEILGDFYSVYETAKEEVTDVDLRFAEMAIAEAKLMEAAVMLPIYSDGGSYQLRTMAPHAAGGALWGNDVDRFHNAITTQEIITAEDYAALKDLYTELKGTGTYEEQAVAYLTEKGYTLKDTFAKTYTSDPVTYDVLATSRSADNQVLVNTFDGLAEYDSEGTQQPALAESWEVSDDGLTYTFHLREGVKWVDSQGREVGTVTADDFVAGFQHMMDAQGGLEYLVEGIITGAAEYIAGEISDMSQVGIAAADDYTLVYTLEAPCPYFLSMLSYSPFAPMNRAYYESQGGKFGLEYDSAAADYVYGTSPDTIAYCGPYLITNSTAENTIVFSANESYWNADGIRIHTITWLYNDGTDPTKAYNDFLAGILDSVALNSSTLSIAKEDGNFDLFATVSDTDASSFMGFFNVNRQGYANFNDETTVVSAMTEEDQAKTNAAMQNVHFRRALAYSIDRESYNAQGKGDELALFSLRNTYTPATYVSLSEDTTVAINGEDVTFAAGTYYGEIMQAQIDADGVSIKVWDADTQSGDGFDGWYSAENAAAELAIAVEELAAEGYTVDADNPVCIDYPQASFSESWKNKANALKQSVENATGGAIIVNLVSCADSTEWYYAGYYCDYGFEANYNFYDVSGWSPDYGDPSTYLDTFLPDFSGYMVKCIGLY